MNDNAGDKNEEARPKNPRSSVRFFGGGQVRMAATLSYMPFPRHNIYSIPTLAGEMTCPKKVTFFWYS